MHVIGSGGVESKLVQLSFIGIMKGSDYALKESAALVLLNTRPVPRNMLPVLIDLIETKELYGRSTLVQEIHLFGKAAIPYIQRLINIKANILKEQSLKPSERTLNIIFAYEGQAYEDSFAVKSLTEVISYLEIFND